MTAQEEEQQKQAESPEQTVKSSLTEKLAAVLENTLHGVAAATMLHSSGPNTDSQQFNQPAETAGYEQSAYWKENGNDLSTGKEPGKDQQAAVENAFDLLQTRQDLNERDEKMKKDQEDNQNATRYEGISPDASVRDYWQQSHRVDDSNVTFTNELSGQSPKPVDEIFKDFQSNYTNYLIGPANGDGQQAAGMASRDLYQQLAQQNGGNTSLSDFDQLTPEERNSLVEKTLSDQYGQEAVSRLQEQQEGVERTARETRHR